MHHAAVRADGRCNDVDILARTATLPNGASPFAPQPLAPEQLPWEQMAPRFHGAPPIAPWRDIATGLVALGDRVVCAFVGVLGLRSINLGYSRSTGDRVLAAVLDRLCAVAGPTGQVARVGGDRFMVAVPAREWNAARLDAIVDAFHAPVHVDLGNVRVRVAIGVWFGQASDGIHLLDCAEETLREAVRQGAGAVVVADTRSTLTARSDALIVSRFDDARSEITAHFQPIVDLLTGDIVGLEALARWTSRDLGEIPPTAWVPLAENSGLIHEFGIKMLSDALDFVAASRARGEWGERYMSVNISPIQLEDPGFVGRVLALLAERDLPSSVLLLELTEANTMTDFERITERLKLLHWHGVRTALDDFGTGIANFEYLRGVPLDLLKIDRHFVAGMLTNPLDRAIVRAVITVAAELGMGVLAEGVETSQQHAALLRLGCNRAQGFLYSAARPPATALDPVRVPHAHTNGAYPLPIDDEQRVRVLRAACLLDTPPDPDFDRLARAAADLCETPIAVVSLIDEQRQWFKARVGVDLEETDRSEAFCAHTICQPGLLEVRDATLDTRFARFDVVRGPAGVRFYAGVPIGTDDGYPLGTLCVTDVVPRELTVRQREGLIQLAQHASLLLSAQRYRSESRTQSVGLHRLELTNRHLLERLALIVSGVDEGVVVVGEDGRIRALGEAVTTLVGRDPDPWVGQPLWRFLDDTSESSTPLVERWFRGAMLDVGTPAPLLHLPSTGGELSLALHRAPTSDEMVVLIRPANSPIDRARRDEALVPSGAPPTR